MTKRLWIWCNETITRDRTTGIERVVQNIVSQCIDLSREQGFEVTPVMQVDDDIVLLDQAALTLPRPRVVPTVHLDENQTKAVPFKKLAKAWRWYRVKLRDFLVKEAFRVIRQKKLRRLIALRPMDYWGVRSWRRLRRWVQGAKPLAFPQLRRVGPDKDLRGIILLHGEVTWHRQ